MCVAPKWAKGCVESLVSYKNMNIFYDAPKGAVTLHFKETQTVLASLSPRSRNPRGLARTKPVDEDLTKKSLGQFPNYIIELYFKTEACF